MPTLTLACDNPKPTLHQLKALKMDPQLKETQPYIYTYIHIYIYIYTYVRRLQGLCHLYLYLYPLSMSPSRDPRTSPAVPTTWSRATPSSAPQGLGTAGITGAAAAAARAALLAAGSRVAREPVSQGQGLGLHRYLWLYMYNTYIYIYISLSLSLSTSV